LAPFCASEAAARFHHSFALSNIRSCATRAGISPTSISLMRAPARSLPPPYCFYKIADTAGRQRLEKDCGGNWAAAAPAFGSAFSASK
jgi:hypothetical protein